MTTVTTLARLVADPRTNDVVRIVLMSAAKPYSDRVHSPLRAPVRLSRLALSTQAVVALALLLVLVVLGSLVASTAVLRDDLEKQYEQRALAIARSLASSPTLAADVVSGRPDPRGPVQREAERVRRATGALYVVVTDDRGIRYSHPTVANIGQPVSTSPDEALAGHEVVTIERGTLGYSARGKVPLRGADGRVVGEVSVGIAISELERETHKLVVLLGLVALGPLAVGLAGAVLLARRLRRTTLGLVKELIYECTVKKENEFEYSICLLCSSGSSANLGVEVFMNAVDTYCALYEKMDDYSMHRENLYLGDRFNLISPIDI